jgi:hypothetical protein
LLGIGTAHADAERRRPRIAALLRARPKRTNLLDTEGRLTSYEEQRNMRRPASCRRLPERANTASGGRGRDGAARRFLREAKLIR